MVHLASDFTVKRRACTFPRDSYAAYVEIPQAKVNNLSTDLGSTLEAMKNITVPQADCERRWYEAKELGAVGKEVETKDAMNLEVR